MAHEESTNERTPARHRATHRALRARQRLAAQFHQGRDRDRRLGVGDLVVRHACRRAASGGCARGGRPARLAAAGQRAHAPGRCPAPGDARHDAALQARSHRHQAGVRPRRVRGLHGHDRRCCALFLLDAYAPGARPRDHDGRGAGGPRRRASPRAERVYRGAGSAVRLLHAGAGHGGRRAAARQPQPDARGSPPRDVRQPVPLRRLRPLPERGHAGGGANRVDRGACAPPPGRSPMPEPDREGLHAPGRDRQGHRARQVRRGLPSRRNALLPPHHESHAARPSARHRRFGSAGDGRGCRHPHRRRRPRNPRAGQPHPHQHAALRRRAGRGAGGGGRDHRAGRHQEGQAGTRTASLRGRPAREPASGRAQRPRGREHRGAPGGRLRDQVDRRRLRRRRGRPAPDGRGQQRVVLRRPRGRFPRRGGRARRELRHGRHLAPLDGAEVGDGVLAEREVSCLRLQPEPERDAREPGPLYRDRAGRPGLRGRVLRRRIRVEGQRVPRHVDPGPHVAQDRPPGHDAHQPGGGIRDRVGPGGVPGPNPPGVPG